MNETKLVQMGLVIQPLKGAGEFRKVGQEAKLADTTVKQLQASLKQVGAQSGGGAGELTRQMEKVTKQLALARHEAAGLKRELAEASKLPLSHSAAARLAQGAAGRMGGGGGLSGLFGGGGALGARIPGIGLGGRALGAGTAIAGTYGLMSWLGQGAGNYSAVQSGVPQSFAGPRERFPGEKWLSDKYHTFTGRDIKDRWEDFQIGRNATALSRESAGRAELRSFNAQSRRALGPTAELSPGIAAPSNEFQALGREKLSLLQEQRQVQQAITSLTEKQVQGDVAKAQKAAELVALNQQLATIGKELGQVDLSRVESARQLHSLGSSILRSEADKFADLGPEHQRAALAIGQKIKAGDELSFSESKLAGQLGPLSGILKDRRRDASAGAFEQFKLTVGFDRQTEQTLKDIEGRGIKLGASFDATELRQQLTDAVRDAGGLIRMTVRDAIAAEQNEDKTTDEREQGRQGNFRG